MVDVSVPCEGCGKDVRDGDEFCQVCGAKVSEQLKAALRARLESSQKEGPGYFNALGLAPKQAFVDHTKQLKSARATIGGLSVLFVLGGVVMFFITKGQADTALNNFSGQPDSALLVSEIAGNRTVGELRGALAREPWQVLGLNLFLAAVMFGLWVWSKRSLLPAVISALGIYVTVIIASALFDPTTLASGIIMKILVIAALAKGVQSALAARKLELGH